MKNQLKFSLVAAVALTAFTTNLYAANSGGNVSGDAYSGSGASGNTVNYDTHTSGVNYVYGSNTNTTTNANNVIIGGNVALQGVIGGNTLSGDSTNNVVTIGSTGDINHVRGGFGSGSVSNNTVNILNGAYISEFVRGGQCSGSCTMNNNTLNIGTQANPITAARINGIQNFNNMSFYLSGNVGNGSTVVSTNGYTVYLSGVNIQVTFQNGNSLTNGQNIINLIGGSSTINGWSGTQTINVPIGTSSQVSGNISQSGNNLQLSFNYTAPTPGPGPTPGPIVVANDGAKSVSETRIAQSSMVNLATDFIVDKVQNSLKPVDELQSFGYVGAGVLKYNSGSHIDTKGVNVNVGLGKRYDDFSFGGFLEYGFSTYESVVGNVEADGQSHLYGLGLFAKQMFSNKFYLVSSLHGGLVESDYSRKDMDATYDTRSPYVGFDFGMGKLVTLGKNQNIDLYAKYLFGFVASDDVTLSTGEEYKFEAVKSHRAKAGLKFNQTIRNFNFIYAGLGTQYEFSNESRASFRSGPLSEEAPRPSLKGVSGIGEVGYRFRPTEELSFEIGGKYYIGKMQGLSGNAGFQYRF